MLTKAPAEATNRPNDRSPAWTGDSTCPTALAAMTNAEMIIAAAVTRLAIPSRRRLAGDK
jgi:hypothetical protein